MWSAKDKVMTYDQAKADANNAKKDMKLVHAHTVKYIMHTLWAWVHWWHWEDCIKWQYLCVVMQGPFDVCRKVFSSGEETAHMSLIDKSDLFFHDYSLAPLFVQENYLHVRPAAAGWVLYYLWLGDI